MDLREELSELDLEGSAGGGRFEQAVTGRKGVLRWENRLSKCSEAGTGH